MQINWGFKIAILYLSFVALILALAIMAMRQKVDLVSKDYYEQEIAYQGKIDKKILTASLSESLSWELQKNKLILKFPKQFAGKKISSQVYFFRPSDVNLDMSFSVNDTSINQFVETNKLKKGLYKMQINWNANNHEYYNEGIVKIN